MKPKSNKVQQKKDRGKYIYIIIVLFITICTFSDSRHNGFVSFDDTGYITNNNLLKTLSFDNIIRIFTPTPYGFVMGNYHPFVVLSDAIIYNFYQLNPEPYHVFNLLLHLINVVLVFIFIRLLLKSNQQSAIKNLAAAFAACIFAVHPLHVENVAWASDLKDLLYTLFYLASLICYIKYVSGTGYQVSGTQNAKVKNLKSTYKFFNYTYCLLFFVLSLLSKSTAVTLPVILILFDYYFRRKLSIISVLEKIPLFSLSIIFGLINIASQKAAGAIVNSSTFNYADRFFMLCYSLMYYFYSLICPVHLANLHPFPVKINELLPIWYYISPLIVLIIFTLLIWLIVKSVKHRKDIIFGLLFFLITICLVLQFTPFGFAVVSERYTYLPYVGLLFILARYYIILSEKKPALMLNVNILLGVVIVIFSIVSYERNKAWKTSTDLLIDLTEKYPKFAMAYDDLGVARMLTSDLEGAITEFNKALEIDPKYYYSYNNRGEARRYMNDQEGAWQDYNRAIQLFPPYSDAYNNRAIIKFNRKDYVGSIVDCTISIILKHDNPNAYNNRASSRMSIHDYNGAYNDYNMALKINPYYADGYKNRGIARFYQKDLTGACNDWKKANELGNAQASQLIQTYCK